jgi:hypothetical protein
MSVSESPLLRHEAGLSGTLKRLSDGAFCGSKSLWKYARKLVGKLRRKLARKLSRKLVRKLVQKLI